MNKQELEKRTKEFAIEIIRFVGTFPKTKESDIIGYQLIKSGTSVGANYREANRAESHNDFIHKIGVVEKEASESQYWLEICQAINLGNTEKLKCLYKECSEFVAIFTSAGKTAKERRAKRGKD
jgi:four helix bundle protein